ncbi:MAG: hypothetical protein IJ158_11580 [Treponema sp.]|nr:hypothetical protein [Treponema sp.]
MSVVEITGNGARERGTPKSPTRSYGIPASSAGMTERRGAPKKSKNGGRYGICGKTCCVQARLEVQTNLDIQISLRDFSGSFELNGMKSELVIARG